MKVCGFTIIRNAIKYDYPVVEAIQSVLPLCDKFIVLIGNSEDETEALIKGIISDKIEIHYSVWDDTLREGGKVLAVETNKAFDLIDQTFDWAIYIQSDEAIHERYHEAIKQSLLNYKSNDKVNGLLLKYLHFYGSYDYVGTSRKWYRNEIRIIKNDKRIRSFRDAQGFRINDRKLNVVPVEAFVYHYGWVKDPLIQARKHKDFNKLWHDDAYVASIAKEIYNYSDIDALALFQESHPEVMKELKEKIGILTARRSLRVQELKISFFTGLNHCTGKRLFEYRNYTILKP